MSNVRAPVTLTCRITLHDDSEYASSTSVPRALWDDADDGQRDAFYAAARANLARAARQQQVTLPDEQALNAAPVTAHVPGPEQDAMYKATLAEIETTGDTDSWH